MSKLSITDAIRTILLDNEDIANRLRHTDSNGDITYNFLPLYAPDGTTGDFILFKRDKFDLERSKMGIAQEKCEIILNVVCSDYEDGQQLTELVYQALEHHFTSPLDMTVELSDSSEDVATIKDTSGTAAVRYVQILYLTIK